MPQLKSFAPDHLEEAAQASGFLQCPKCGLVWFGNPDFAQCPQAPHGPPVRVVLLCRSCDAEVPATHLATHLAGRNHVLCAKPD